MRNLLFAGAAGLALALTAVSAEAQSILDRPSASPYAVLDQGQALGLGADVGFAPGLNEGRSAFVEGLAQGFAGNGNGAIKNAAPVTQLDVYPAR